MLAVESAPVGGTASTPANPTYGGPISTSAVGGNATGRGGMRPSNPIARVKPRQSVGVEPDPPMGPMALAPSQKFTYFRRGAQRRPISLK